MRLVSHLLLAATVGVAAAPALADTTRTWALSEFAEPLYADAPAHLPYANPEAPKGGRITLGEFGTFDTLNFHVAKGDWPSSISLIYDSLMESNDNEVDAYYGVIAESVEYPADKRYAVFHLREEARYHDGSPIVAADFVYSLQAKKEHGRPWIKSLYEDLSHAEALDDRTLKVHFNTTGSTKPIIRAASMSPLPEDFWASRDITATTLEPPKTSGPYRIKRVDAGRSIVYERVPDYWAAGLPLKAGLHNFGEIQYDFYRDETAMFEAFKAGKIDFRAESSAKRWVSEYDLPQVEDGRVLLDEVAIETPRGLFGFYFNMSNEKFAPLAVREALVRLFDFETLQRTVLYGKFRRLSNYFNGAGYESSGVPVGAELALLEPHRDALPAALFTAPFALPVTDGTGRDRRQKRAALKLFQSAGWTQKGGKLVDVDGTVFSIEIMTAWPEVEKFVSQYLDTLKGLGIDASLRIVDSAQWRERAREKQFDALAVGKPFVVPPGNELKSQYGTASALERGANTSAITNPVIDALIDDVVAARTQDEIFAATHALDRVLLWNHYSIPLYYRPRSWVAWWDRFSRPAMSPRYALGVTSTWWIDADKAAALEAR
ncbi:MAG: extracellular solute-binding protein [Pseudomonadota bacterium]